MRSETTPHSAPAQRKAVELNHGNHWMVDLRDGMFDTYVRMRIGDLRALQPVHLYSEIEPDAIEDDAPVDTLSGFTEWSAQAERALSFGWDWTYEPDAGRMLAQWASLRTNLMVIDDDGHDMGLECTRLCIARLMTRARWEHVTAPYLGLNP